MTDPIQKSTRTASSLRTMHQDMAALGKGSVADKLLRALHILISSTNAEGAGLYLYDDGNVLQQAPHLLSEETAQYKDSALILCQQAITDDMLCSKPIDRFILLATPIPGKGGLVLIIPQDKAIAIDPPAYATQYIAGCIGLLLIQSSANKANTPINRKKIALGTLTTFFLLLLPIPYTINAPLTVEPAVRRFATVPFNSILEKAHVVRGDTVKAGQLLATLDGKELSLEKEAKQAERSRFLKKRDTALHAGNIAEAQVAKLEADKRASDIALLDYRIGKLNVASPIDGIVIDGDLDHASGAALQKGDTLFEVAPLSTVRLEAGFDVRDSLKISKNDPMTIALNAIPGKTWDTPITTIRPKVEIHENTSVVVVEATLDNPNGHLKPSMTGEAKVDGGWRSMGWVLFHKPLQTLKRWIF